MSTPTLEIEKLNVEERLRLIEQLWDSLCEDPSKVPLTEAQRQELDRRLDAIGSGDETGIPWENVLRRIQDRLG
jgi:putative addiction module component (TIGR02574 family)